MNTVDRRTFLKTLYNTAVGLGLSSLVTLEDLAAADNSTERMPVIWLQGCSCSGCSCALLNLVEMPMYALLTRYISLVFHTDLSAATGHQFTELMAPFIEEKHPFILVVEGSLPVDIPHACMIAEKPVTEWVAALAKNAAFCIGVGTCAAFGGITRMMGMQNNAVSLKTYLEQVHIQTPTVLLPNCPMMPEHFVYTALYLLKVGRLPDVDSFHRPLALFQKTVHEWCIHHESYQEDYFAKFIGDEGCLFHLGCQGPVTYNNCVPVGHNENVNTCIKAGHPCIGCAGYVFPRQILYHHFNEFRTLEKQKK